MPKKYTYPAETLEILESLWAQGMQNCSTDENKLKIQQASLTTGLVDERIKLWIYGRNRKKKRDDGQQPKRKKPCSITTKASISTKDNTENASNKISQDAAVEIDPDCSRQRRGDPDQDSTSSSDEEIRSDLAVQDSEKVSRQDTAGHIIQSVEEKIQEFQACNCDVVVLVYNHSSRCLSTAGTMKGLGFLTSQTPGIDLQFAAAVSLSSCDCT